jgi:hypothetical protein
MSADAHAHDDPRRPALRRPWQSQILTRADELEFVLDRVVGPVDAERSSALIDLREQLGQVRSIGRARIRRLGLPRRGVPEAAAVERAFGLLDSIEVSILRLAGSGYVIGQLPSLLAQVRSHLPIGDERLRRLEAIAAKHALPKPPPGGCYDPLCDEELNAVIAAMRASALEGRRELARVRSLARIFHLVAAVLILGALGLGLVGVFAKEVLPLCFTPSDQAVVCPVHAISASLTRVDDESQVARRDEHLVDQLTGQQTTRGDIAIVELLGLVAASIAGARALRQLEGTSTPYDLPLASAILKVPTGAITAVLGLVLMRGGFVPGLSALDNTEQILAWAVIFGFSQELFTRFADTQAQAVLGKVGTPGDQKLPDGTTVPSHGVPA